VVEQAVALYRERYADVGWRENTVYDGIEDAVARLARAMPVYVCTSKPAIFAQRIVTLFGLAPYVRRVYGTDLDGALDDKAKLFAHAARSEGFDPEAAVLVGDRAQDVRAARLNAARAIGVLWGYGSREELAGADAVVAAPSAIDDAIAAL
jgi:phosphoglycolate phosphatase